jgi:hypothetical protein
MGEKGGRRYTPDRGALADASRQLPSFGSSMKRLVRSIVVVVVLVAAAIGVWKGRQTTSATSRDPAPRPDSAWYHASNVALLAATGRPQLVEFFHPD